MIHTFGDSHCKFGWNNVENVIHHHIGPKLCYTFGKGKLNTLNINSFNINNGDSIVFCFGEIDCRCHIHKHISHDNAYTIIIDEIVNNYCEAIKVNLNNAKFKFKNICIYNVVPPVEKYNTKENKEYPFIGSDEERKMYVLYFNKCLKEKCAVMNWLFVDIYDKYIDENGFLNKLLSDKNVHIENGKYLQEFINDNFQR